MPEKEPKGYTPKEVFQKVKSENQWEVDIKLEPEHIPWVYIGNIIQRSLARMIGQGPYGPVSVKCTAEGNLAVVSRGGAFDDYEVLEFAFSSANESHDFTFAQQVQRIDMFTYDGKTDYQLSRDLVKALGDKIELFEDSFYSLDVYTRKVRATSKAFNPRSTGTETSHTADKLVDSGADFVTDAVSIGDAVANITDNLSASVTAIDDLNTLSLSDDIFTATGSPWAVYSVEGTRVKIVGWFSSEG